MRLADTDTSFIWEKSLKGANSHVKSVISMEPPHCEKHKPCREAQKDEEFCMKKEVQKPFQTFQHQPSQLGPHGSETNCLVKAFPKFLTHKTCWFHSWGVFVQKEIMGAVPISNPMSPVSSASKI